MEKYPQLINQSDNSVIVINNAMFCIGRSLTCDHIIESLDVSRFHCTIKKNNDKWILCDRSTNGTIVNSELYTFNKSVPLRDGDTIKLGASNVSFIFRNVEETNKHLENSDVLEKGNSSCTAPSIFPDDEVVIEEAASLLAEGVEEAHSRGECFFSNDNSEQQINNELEKNTTGAQNSAENKNSAQNYDIVGDELTCSICSELFIKAVTLNCSHTFCKYCIDTWKKHQLKCPICRKPITNIAPTLVLDNFIEKIVDTQNDEAKEVRKQLVKQREEVDVNTASSSMEAIVVDDGNSGYEDEDSDMSYTDSDDLEYDNYVYRSRRRRNYYGGYGNCYICGAPGHWANSCPFK